MLVESPQTMVRGANDPDVVWLFKADGEVAELADRFELEIEPLNSRSIYKDSEKGELTLDAAMGACIWTPSVEEAKSIGKGEGRYALYGTLEGRRRLWASGPFYVEGPF